MVSQASKQGRTQDANLFNREGTMDAESLIVMVRIFLVIIAGALWMAAGSLIMWLIKHYNRRGIK